MDVGVAQHEVAVPALQHAPERFPRSTRRWIWSRLSRTNAASSRAGSVLEALLVAPGQHRMDDLVTTEPE